VHPYADQSHRAPLYVCWGRQGPSNLLPGRSRSGTPLRCLRSSWPSGLNTAQPSRRGDIASTGLSNSPALFSRRHPVLTILHTSPKTGGVSLNVKQISVKVRDGVTIQDITYTGSNRDTVPAYLVIPKGSGKFAGAIWGHWLMPGAANSNRDEFLDEAIALAPAGVVSLLIDAPQSRPNFKRMPNPVLIAQQVVDLRRGLDLLLSRPDVDATRIAYVGHSWDAGTGAILDAADKRFAAFVFMSGPQSTMEYVLSSPGMIALRKTNDTEGGGGGTESEGGRVG
jgi:hypothetical protein